MTITLAEISRRYDIPVASIRTSLRSEYAALGRMPGSLELNDEQVAHILASFPDETTRPLDGITTAELLERYALILAELRVRGVVRTANAPLGDYAEHLALQVYGGTLAKNSGKSYDLQTDAGSRIQVKARAVGRAHKRATEFSAFRSFDFDLGCFLLFDARTYKLIWARELLPDLARSLARHSNHVNADHLTSAIVEREGTDVTEKFKRAS